MICGGITAMALTQPRNRLATGVAPIDPVTVAGALRVMYYKSPYPQKTNVNSGNPASNGDAVVQVPDQLIATEFNGFDRVFNSVAQPYPLMQSDGLQFGTAGLYVLQAYNAVIQAGIGSFTCYIWGTYAGANFWVPYGNENTSSGIFVDDTGFFNLYDNTASPLVSLGGVPTGKILCRCSYDVTTGALRADTTGGNSTGNTSVTPGSTLSFDAISRAPGLDASVINGSVDNRYLGWLFYDHVIPFAGATDLGLRAFISQDGPYTL